MAFERKYSDEVRQQSVSRVLERKQAEPRNRSIIREVASEYNVGEQSLRLWVARHDDGAFDYDAEKTSANGVEQILSQSSSSGKSLLRRISELEDEIEQLREENSVLKRAVAIFAAEANEH